MNKNVWSIARCKLTHNSQRQWARALSPPSAAYRIRESSDLLSFRPFAIFAADDDAFAAQPSRARKLWLFFQQLSRVFDMNSIGAAVLPSPHRRARDRLPFSYSLEVLKNKNTVFRQICRGDCSFLGDSERYEGEYMRHSSSGARSRAARACRANRANRRLNADR